MEKAPRLLIVPNLEVGYTSAIAGGGGGTMSEMKCGGTGKKIAYIYIYIM